MVVIGLVFCVARCDWFRVQGAAGERIRRCLRSTIILLRIGAGGVYGIGGKRASIVTIARRVMIHLVILLLHPRVNDDQEAWVRGWDTSSICSLLTLAQSQSKKTRTAMMAQEM